LQEIDSENEIFTSEDDRKSRQNKRGGRNNKNDKSNNVKIEYEENDHQYATRKRTIKKEDTMSQYNDNVQNESIHVET